MPSLSFNTFPFKTPRFLDAQKVSKKRDVRSKVNDTALSHDHAGVSCTIEELSQLKLSAAQLKFPLKHRSKSHLNGSKSTQLRGRGIDFDEVRAYQAGDEIRSIDWRVTARTGHLHTKVYKEEKEKPVYVLLDQRQRMFFGSQLNFKSVTACHIASLLAWSSINNGDRLGAIIFSDTQHDELKPKSSIKSVLHFLNLAANYSQALLPTHPSNTQNFGGNAKAENLNSILEKLLHIIRPGSLVYVISDFHDLEENARQNLSLMSRHNDIIAIQVSDPLEQSLPQASLLSFTSNEQAGEQGAMYQVNSQQAIVRSRYQEHFQDKQSSIEQILAESNIQLIALSTEETVSDQLTRTVRAR